MVYQHKKKKEKPKLHPTPKTEQVEVTVHLEDKSDVVIVSLTHGSSESPREEKPTHGRSTQEGFDRILIPFRQLLKTHAKDESVKISPREHWEGRVFTPTRRKSICW
jgi:hypothetical protein